MDVAARRIPAKFGLDPRRDVQVLAPMHRGPAGAGALNGLLQQAVTPGRPDLPEKRFGGRVFRVGDKVTQIRNNYDKGENGVFNGTVGVVTSLDPVDQRLTVLTDEDEEVPYEFDELDELAHAYAVTIHRSQGSEYPGRGDPRHHGRLDDAAAESSLYGGHPREEARRPRRFPQGDRPGGADGVGGPPLHGPGLPARGPVSPAVTGLPENV